MTFTNRQRGMAVLSLFLGAPLIVGLTQVTDDPESTSTLLIHKSYDLGGGLGRGTRQLYFRLPNGDCSSKKKLAAFSLITGSEKAVTVPAGHQTQFWAFTEFFSIGMKTLCQNSFAFTPQKSHSYNLALVSNVMSHCRVNVIDMQTGAPPEDITYNNTLNCKQL